jgi:hypothetical protein
MFASMHAHSTATQTLLEAQADVNAANEVPHPWQGRPQARIFINYLRFCHARQGGWTALMLASQQGHTALVELLLDSKADPNVQDKGVIRRIYCGPRDIPRYNYCGA